MTKPVEQMELHFEAKAHTAQRLPRRTRRISRARWWFQQMRRAVDDALDWTPAPPARPEQAQLTLATR